MGKPIASLPRPPQHWTADDLHDVVATMGDVVGVARTRKVVPARMQFVGQDGELVRLRVEGPSGVGTTDPLPISPDTLGRRRVHEEPARWDDVV